MKVLLTNDDGIEAIGLRVMREALLEVPEMELAVIAPDSNRSATARSITTRQPLWVEEVDFGDGGSGFATDGTPVDCVRFAALGLVEFEPELIVSGINHGANLGDDITYSGTVAAALEGVVLGHPGHRGLAAGLPRAGSTPGSPARVGAGRTSSRSPPSWRAWSRRWHTCRCREGTLLNVNCPAGDAQGARACRLGKRDLPRPDEARPRRRAGAAATGSTASSPGTTRRTAPTSRRWPTAASPSRRCTST